MEYSDMLSGPQASAPFHNGEALDIYKQGTSGHYQGSDDDAILMSRLFYLALWVCGQISLYLAEQSNGNFRMVKIQLEEATALPFSGRYYNFELHTHAPIKYLLFHLGPAAFVGNNHTNLTLTACNVGLGYGSPRMLRVWH